jgi:hypothetical protein
MSKSVQVWVQAGPARRSYRGRAGCRALARHELALFVLPANLVFAAGQVSHG